MWINKYKFLQKSLPNFNVNLIEMLSTWLNFWIVETCGFVLALGKDVPKQLQKEVTAV